MDTWWNFGHELKKKSLVLARASNVLGRATGGVVSVKLSALTVALGGGRGGWVGGGLLCQCITMRVHFTLCDALLHFMQTIPF
jgi:hypothetical protein